MSKHPEKNLLFALDIGTSKIVALVGEVSQDNQIRIIGFGMHPSHGLKRGVVVNIESTVQSIQRAVEEAELMAGCEMRATCTGIAGSHIRSLNSHGIVAIHDHEINQSDIDRVIDAARAVAIPSDQKILHILPQEFIIDNQEGVREPVGMSGIRLEAKVHIVTGAVSAAQNITKCVRRCGLQVGDMVLEQLASSHSVLTDDEKELGVCMVDIGGGTTDIAIFTGDAIRHTHVIPVAGDHVTNDVAVALRTPIQYAEQIKIKYASVLPENVDPKAIVQIPSITRQPLKQVKKRTLDQVVAARYEELFALVLAELQRSGFEHLIAAGIVLTGGASRILGCIELGERIFQMPVRLGLPQYVNGLVDIRDNPIYATAVGLLLHGYHNQINNRSTFNLDRGLSLWKRMKNWFQGNF
ncbi:cell division protein FtsA [Coxiella endosymbiont of Amblyomma americanum]|uniref:cell division protein FtsA n=1 Tax=Coxiella endosymbiont of Amblyomma americanum TaxID=325775 RepID=UPI000580A61F|nr:cell division protein FtsA [Coxiella endosymbiont of Amblyomma americanum]AJC50398.1 cell division protein FtsA [Coxiella endosymbiont of Amblyomma americanum]AUJ58740.1 cell division protein FtsA [Coxiella-like endosymbiont of Amblyomma americanum]